VLAHRLAGSPLALEAAWLARNEVRLGPMPFLPPRPIRPMTQAEQAATDAFHRAYYAAWTDGRGTIDLAWLGYRTLKCPMDLWIYQEIVVETMPDLIVECGTYLGGSALYLASICALVGRGRVLSVDIEAQPDRPHHPVIDYVTGSSIDPALVDRIRDEASGRRTMVILDSDHAKAHVLAELESYQGVVAVGCYLVVEDTKVNGHPVLPDFGPGPMEAVEAFLAAHPEFVVDRDRERFMMTLNPAGYLRRAY
jgi:cephalosporin hydroxylase